MLYSVAMTPMSTSLKCSTKRSVSCESTESTSLFRMESPHRVRFISNNPSSASSVQSISYMTHHAKRRKRKKSDLTTSTCAENYPMQTYSVKTTMRTAYSSYGAMLSTNARWKPLKRPQKMQSKYRKIRRMKKRRKRMRNLT